LLILLEAGQVSTTKTNLGYPFVYNVLQLLMQVILSYILVMKARCV